MLKREKLPRGDSKGTSKLVSYDRVSSTAVWPSPEKHARKITHRQDKVTCYARSPSATLRSSFVRGACQMQKARKPKALRHRRPLRHDGRLNRLAPFWEKGHGTGLRLITRRFSIFNSRAACPRQETIVPAVIMSKKMLSCGDHASSRLSSAVIRRIICFSSSCCNEIAAGGQLAGGGVAIALRCGQQRPFSSDTSR